MNFKWTPHKNFQHDPQPEDVEYVKRCQSIMTCLAGVELYEQQHKCTDCPDRKLCENLHRGEL